MIRPIRRNPFDLQWEKILDMNQRVRDRMTCESANRESVELLIALASAELAGCYKFTLICCDLLCHQEENLEKIAKRVLKENLKHFEVLATRIYELGGDLPEDIRKLRDRFPFSFASLPRAGDDIQSILVFLICTEGSFIEGYRSLCSKTEFEDKRTFDLANRILIEKMEHETWLLESLPGTTDTMTQKEQVRSVLERFSPVMGLQDQGWAESL